MADTKISALTAATTPLAGTEVVPLVQSGATKKVAVSDLTAGRAVSMASVNVSSSAANSAVAGVYNNDTADGNGVYVKAGGANSGKYNTYLQNAAGQDLLVVYADGTVQTGIGNIKINTAGKGIDFSAASHAAGMTSELLNDYEEGTFTPSFTNLTVGNGSVFGRYTKTGRIVSVQLGFTYGSTSSISGSIGDITGLPFTAVNIASNTFQLSVGTVFKPGTGWWSIMSNLQANTSTLFVTTTLAGVGITSATPTTFASGTTLTLSITYETA